MTYEDLLLNLPVIEEFGNEALPAKLSLRLGMRVGRLRTAVEEVSRVRRKLLENLAEKDENGQPKIDSNQQYVGVDMDEFRRQYQEVLEETVEVDLPNSLTSKDFEELEALKPSVVASLVKLGLLTVDD